jgi:hypothetical protein
MDTEGTPPREDADAGTRAEKTAPPLPDDPRVPIPEDADPTESRELGGAAPAVGPGDAARRIGRAPTTTDVSDPERSSRNTAAGSGSEPGEGPVQPAADEGVDPSAGIEPHNEGLV